LARLFPDTPVSVQGEPQPAGKQQFKQRTEQWIASPFSGGSGTFDAYGRERMTESFRPVARPMTEEQAVQFKAEAEAELERLKIEPTVTVPVLRDVARIKESGNPRLWLAEEGLYSRLEYFARETTRDPDAAMEYLTIRIRRCKAQSRAAFIAWGIQQIAKQAGDHFHLKANAIKEFDIGVSDLLSHALANGSKYVDFPQNEHDEKAGVYRVNMGTRENPIVWTIPESLWGYALKLWPVHLRKSRDGYYLTKTTGGEEVAAHRLALQPSPMDTIESKSGNLLDWTSLSIKKWNMVGNYYGLYENKRKQPQGKFEKNNIVRLNPIRTDDGQELSVIDNTASDDTMNFGGENVSRFSGGSPYHRKILPNADLGDSDYSSAYERNDALESNEEQRTTIGTTRTIGEEE
jgi:hypothetical protein